MEKVIWDRLKKEGFTDFGAAGLMGNLYAESGLRSNNMEDSYQSKLHFTDESYTKAVDEGIYTNFVKDGVGYGLAQWTYWSLKKDLLEFAQKQNKSIGDPKMQIEFLIWELKTQFTAKVYNVLKNAQSILEASNAVLLNFERPANMGQAVQQLRVQYGQKYYDKYASNLVQEEKQMKQYKRGSKVQLSENFNSSEFDCHGSQCCNTTMIDGKLVEYLQKIRNHFNKPITITSAYRCEVHNKRVGGATKSYHMQGKAADIVVKGVSSREVAKYAESIGILGIGLYETSQDGYFTHIDTRTTKAFWYGQNEAPRDTFKDNQSIIPVIPDDKIPVEYSTYHKSKNKYSIKLIYLQKGDKGRDVQILQELLKVHGYNIEATGIFDSMTYAAVIDFQKKTKKIADGIVGAETMLLLLTA